MCLRENLQKVAGEGWQNQYIKIKPLILESTNPNMPIKLSTEIANKKAQELYHFLGFKRLAEKDGDDLIFEL